MYKHMEDSFGQKLKTFVKQHWLTVSFILGFFTDALLLNRIDDVFDNIVLLTYATLATTTLLLFYVGVAQKVPEWFSKKLVRFMPAVMQYSFGGLLSGMLIFYGRSGDWVTSAPFLLLILSVIFGNELVHKRSDRLVYHLALYFIGLFSYVVLVLPVLLGVMGDLVFFLSGVAALLIVTIVAQVLYRIVPNFMRVNTRRIILVIGSIYIGLNILYFTSVIPPIPLSLTELEIVHSVVPVQEGSYRVVAEAQPWFGSLPFVKTTLHPPTASIACFARVYAPAKLSVEIFHRWQYKNSAGDWVEHARIKYPIAGANQFGYKGYSIITARNGTWRCSVETARGQVLGRSTVEVQIGGKPNGPVTRME